MMGTNFLKEYANTAAKNSIPTGQGKNTVERIA